MIRFWIALLCTTAAANSLATGFEATLSEPSFTVSIPTLPDIKLRTHPLQSSGAHFRLMGSDGPYTISIVTPTADAGMSPIECASSTIRSITSSPGAPDPSRIYRAKINDTTFVALYVTALAEQRQLHANFLSAVGGTHCIHVRVTMYPATREDFDAWFTRFKDARIEAAK